MLVDAAGLVVFWRVVDLHLRVPWACAARDTSWVPGPAVPCVPMGPGERAGLVHGKVG